MRHVRQGFQQVCACCSSWQSSQWLPEELHLVRCSPARCMMQGDPSTHVVWNSGRVVYCGLLADMHNHAQHPFTNSPNKHCILVNGAPHLGDTAPSNGCTWPLIGCKSCESCSKLQRRHGRTHLHRSNTVGSTVQPCCPFPRSPDKSKLVVLLAWGCRKPTSHIRYTSALHVGTPCAMSIVPVGNMPWYISIFYPCRSF
jgi:hypothetical protein